MHGQGTYKWPSGNIYEGEWVGDKRNGRGTQKSNDGKILKAGNWKNDVFQIILTANLN
jgi:hypothetical protein